MQPIGIRLGQRDLQRVDRLADASPFRRSALMRALLRVGLDRAEVDPAVLLGAPLHLDPPTEAPA